MSLVGELSLWVALLMAAWTTIVSFAGGAHGRADLVRSGERALCATFAFTLLASLGIWAALFSHDFALKFVASYSSANLPSLYTLTAIWAGPAGSLLFSALILTLYSAIAVVTHRRSNRRIMPWVTGTLGAIALFVLIATCFGNNPYERLDWIPPDGRGMNPQLQHPGMAMHPPVLYLGLIATAIPFAFAIGALISRRLNAEWFSAVRGWSLLSWGLLTIGIVLGMWWSYMEPRLAGAWAWDAFEHASFLPWLAESVFLNSLLIHESRGMLRKWNVSLVVATFLLAIPATLISRSGPYESVYSFARSPLRIWLVGLILAATLLVAYVVSRRLDDFQSNAELSSMSSRDVSSLPLIGRNRRRYGSYIVYFGIALLCCAFAGQMLSKGLSAAVKTGETINATDAYGHRWAFKSLGLSRFEQLNRRVLALTFDVTRDGQKMGVLSSEQRQYIDSSGEPTFEPSTEAAIHHSFAQDVYMRFTGEVDAETTAVQINFNPLISWVWIGGIVMAVGGVIVLGIGRSTP